MRRIPVALAALACGVLTACAPAGSGGPSRPVVTGDEAQPLVAGWGWPVLAKTSPTAGWSTPTYRAWYSKSVTGEQFSSPAVADLDRNGVLDVVAGFPDGKVHVFRTDTGAIWRTFDTGAGAVQASLTLVDLDRDGRLDVLVANTGGNVMAFRWTDGRRIFAKRAADGVHLPGVFATPVAADLDRDGWQEIIVPGWDHWLHVWRFRDGANLRGFPVFLKDTSWSSPAVADIDRDGWLDIVVGYDCDGVRGQPCYPSRGGYLTAIRHDGRVKAGWPRFIRDQLVWSSPALVDLTGDGKLDVVVGTGNMPMAGGRSVYAFRSDGRLLWRRDVGGRTTSSPAVGDLTGDGRAEVGIVAEDGKLYVLHGNGTVRYAKCIANTLADCANKRLHSSASIADVDGDGRQEVVVGGEQWLTVFDGGGRVKARGETYAGTYPLTAAPSIAAVNGKAWIVAASGSGSAGRVFAWTTGRPLGPAAWPTFRQNTRRSGWITR